MVEAHRLPQGSQEGGGETEGLAFNIAFEGRCPVTFFLLPGHLLKALPPHNSTVTCTEPGLHNT